MTVRSAVDNGLEPQTVTDDLAKQISVSPTSFSENSQNASYEWGIHGKPVPRIRHQYTSTTAERRGSPYVERRELACPGVLLCSL